MSITISTCWYTLTSKFNKEKYLSWIKNFLPYVDNYYLVLYTDMNGYSFIIENFPDILNNPNILIIKKEMEEFYNYRYKTYWERNHEYNYLLNKRTEWKLNMLWAEKIHFVNETYKKNPFNTDIFAWCDIGYFRDGRPPTSFMNKEVLKQKINENYIYYVCVNNNREYLDYLYQIVQNKNELGLTTTIIPPNQYSIAGGFFVLYGSKIEWWKTTFDQKLRLYFENGRLVKDDQIIVLDCVFSNAEKFHLLAESDKVPEDERWFLFKRYLS